MLLAERKGRWLDFGVEAAQGVDEFAKATFHEELENVFVADDLFVNVVVVVVVERQQVVAHGAGEEERILRDHGDASSQRLEEGRGKGEESERNLKRT